MQCEIKNFKEIHKHQAINIINTKMTHGWLYAHESEANWDVKGTGINNQDEFHLLPISQSKPKSISPIVSIGDKICDLPRKTTIDDSIFVVRHPH